jgi:hypothetical protein
MMLLLLLEMVCGNGTFISKLINTRQHSNFHVDKLVRFSCSAVTHELQKLREFFVELLERFGHVTFVPGNHDLWVATSDAEHNIITSVDKFNAVIALCEELGVHTKPFKVGTAKPAWIVPMFAWYHEDFDDDMATRHEPIESWTDFNLCKWPREVCISATVPIYNTIQGW